ncbi:MAG TPA: hypothetical protein VH595_00130 [Verrucomicrobiae bacterium]|nr:hypothetical protein [Verrucomicrobiae bacterium]
MVENIVTDIAEMLYFARNHSLPGANAIVVDAQEAGGLPDAPSYDMTIQIGDTHPIKTKLAVSGPIWSESVYSDLTAVLAKSLQLNSPSKAPAEDVSMLDKLTDSLAQTIANEDVKLSSNLEADFINPGLHEQAAALLGAFALRENSGLFYDIRLPLCRMTAHLALARFLSGDHSPGLVGRVADCMALTLMNNEVTAIDQIGHLDTAQKPVATWARVLRAYNNLDFRSLDVATNVPGIEQVAWFKAYSAASSRSVAWNMVGQAVERQPDFCRMACAMGYSVEMGNVMMRVWLPLEYREIGQVYEAIQGRKLQKGDFIDSLNSNPDRCFVNGSTGAARVRVIGWGLWAMQLQHHLCEAVTGTYWSLSYKLGLPEQSWNFAQEYENSFGQLRFYGFVRRLLCTNEVTYHASTDEGWAFEAQHPQLTPMEWMDYLAAKVSFAPLYRPIPNPHCNEWTSHNPLPGTAYDVDERVDFPSFTGGAQGASKVHKAHEMAPYDIGFCKYIGRSYGTNWTHEAAGATFDQLLPYSATAAACIADSLVKKPEQYEKMMKIAVQWDPSYYQTLASYEWNRGKTNEAMKFYEDQEQTDPDAVSLANLAPMRVTYYLATGQKQKAKEVADFAAGVYSSNGLEAKGEYLEKTGDLSGAFDWFGKIEERYNNIIPLLEFCCRHVGSTGDADLDKNIVNRLAAWSKGREKVTLSDFSAPPTDGVSLYNVRPALAALSVNDGDVIVAERGFRVHNVNDLAITRDIDRSTEMKIIYWHRNGYREITVTLDSGHRLGSLIYNYVPR